VTDEVIKQYIELLRRPTKFGTRAK
jgi:hypothetical protein